VPPLRSRRDDLESLTLHFIARVAEKLGRSPPALSRNALAQLAAHDWPGNVRELQNAVERAVIVSTGGPLRFDVGSSSRTPATKRPLPSSSPGNATLVTRDELKRRERESILEALAVSGGRVFGPGGAAELLGTKPTTLASRIKALGIAKPPSPR
jgi:DNA-binding NtrC family response regulator